MPCKGNPTYFAAGDAHRMVKNTKSISSVQRGKKINRRQEKPEMFFPLSVLHFIFSTCPDCKGNPTVHIIYQYQWAYLCRNSLDWSHSSVFGTIHRKIQLFCCCTLWMPWRKKICQVSFRFSWKADTLQFFSCIGCSKSTQTCFNLVDF